MLIPPSIVVLLIVFVLIAVRKIGHLHLQIWQIMLFGAGAVLATGQISPATALRAIDLDVMLFLFGMFVVGAALEESGYLFYLAHRCFKRAHSIDQLILSVLFVMGFLSAFLMNDTLAIIGTPLMLRFAQKYEISPKLLLLALAFAVTTGSVMSPIGNPQNLLIAIRGKVNNPFVTFLHDLALPTLINLLLAYFVLKLYYRQEFRPVPLVHFEESISDFRLAWLSKISLILICVLIVVKIAVVFLGLAIDFRLTYIALLAALPILGGSAKRWTILKHIDWFTLIFFAAMFVLMDSVWQCGFFQSLLDRSHGDIKSILMILVVSILLSQVISNVPFVALYLPMLAAVGAGTHEMAALASGSTIAGNLLILGAASNVIIIQNAEKKGETLTFFEFAQIGLPLTLLQTFIYWIFLSNPFVR